MITRYYSIPLFYPPLMASALDVNDFNRAEERMEKIIRGFFRPVEWYAAVTLGSRLSLH